MTAAADDKTYTAEEFASAVQTAVDSAVEQANARIAELESNVSKSEQDQAIDTAVAEATSDLTSQLDKLQRELDEANAGKKAAEDALADRDRADEEAAEAAKLETRREERATFVKDLAIFDEEHLDKSKDRWAAMDDETWEAQKAEYQKLADTKGIKPSPLPKDRPAALTATADGEPKSRSTSAVRDVMELRQQGVNTRTITVN